MGLSFLSTNGGSSSFTLPYNVAIGLNQGFSASYTDIWGRAVLCGRMPHVLLGLSVTSTQ